MDNLSFNHRLKKTSLFIKCSCPSQWVPESPRSLESCVWGCIGYGKAQQQSCNRNRKWSSSPRDWDADRGEAGRVISIGNSWDMQVLVALGRGGVLACMCLQCVRGCVLGTAVMWWQFHYSSAYTGWPQEIWSLWGRENKWACHTDRMWTVSLTCMPKYVVARWALSSP